MSDNNVSSFRTMNAMHESLYDVSTVNGLLLQQRMRLSRDSTLQLLVGMQPTEIVTRPTQSGQPQFLMAMPPEVFQMNYDFKTPELSLSMILGRSQIVVAKFQPIEQLKFGAKLVKYRTTTVMPSVSAMVKLPRAVLSVRCESKDHKSVTLVDCQMALGTRDNALGAQLLIRPGESPLFSTMLHHRWGSAMAALAFSRNTDVTVACLRMRKKISERWSAGVNCQVDQNLSSSVALGWIGEIGRCTLNSAVSTTGDIASHFGIAVTPTFRFIVTESLNHHAHAYRTGIAFSWTPKEDK